MNCVRCDRPSTEGANFCQHCGWPVRQRCPYATCKGMVPLVDGQGQPTLRCATCGRAVGHCADPRCRRLDVLGVARCANDHAGRASPVVAPFVDWSTSAGSAGRAYAARLRSERAFVTDRAKACPTTRDNLPGRLGPAIYVSGRLAYTDGGSLYHTEPGSPVDQRLALDAPLPLPPEARPGARPDPTVRPEAEDWRLVGAGRWVACALRDAVTFHDMSGVEERVRRPYAAVGHTVQGEVWTGVVRREGGLEVRVERIGGPPGAPVPLQETRAPRFVVGLSESVALVMEDGAVYRVHEGEAGMAYPPKAQGYGLAHALAHKDRLVMLEWERSIGHRMHLLPLDGSAAPVELGTGAPSSCAPVMLEDRLYLFHNEIPSAGGASTAASAIVPYDLATPLTPRLDPLLTAPGTEFLRAVGVVTPRGHRLFVVRKRDSRQEIVAIDPTTGSETVLYNPGAQGLVRLVLADRALAAFIQESYVRELRTFEIFD